MKSVLEANSSPLAFFNSLLGIDPSSPIRKVENLFNKQKNGPYLRGSISNYTKGLTMTFPMLCDNSLSPETASMLSRANERYIVTMLQMLFASAQFNSTDGFDVISSIHKNIKVRKSLDDYIDAVDNFVGMESTDISKADMADAVRKMEGELKKPLSNFPTDSFSAKSLNDYQVFRFGNQTMVKEHVLNEAPILGNADKLVMDFSAEPKEIQNVGSKDAYVGKNSKFIFANVDGSELNMVQKDQNDAIFKSIQSLHKLSDMQIAQMKMNLANQQFNHQKELDTVRKELDKAKLDQIKRQNDIQDLQNQYDQITKQILDTDIKKANEMAPTLMVVSYNEIDPNSGEMKSKRAFVAGVKSRLIAVDSADIVDRIVAKNKTQLSFLNFIRATTGEISFLADFILCLKQAKIDAKNSIKKGEAARVWKTLESLSIKNNRRKLRKSGNDASAITTLVINQETVNMINKQYEFDLESISNAWQIMNAYNLLGIMIADESTETVKILYSGHDMWETQAYSYLEKESNDKSYRKIINLIGQNRRF